MDEFGKVHYFTITNIHVFINLSFGYYFKVIFFRIALVYAMPDLDYVDITLYVCNIIDCVIASSL